MIQFFSVLVHASVRHFNYVIHFCFLFVFASQRITISEIKRHPWFLKNLPMELMEGGSYQCNDINIPSQSIEEISSILQQARTMPSEATKGRKVSLGGSMDFDYMDDADVEDIETSGEYVCPL